MSDKHGSMTMQDIKGDKAKCKAEDQEKAAAIEAKKQKRAVESAAATAKKAADDAAFAVCEVKCVCGVIPCSWAAWKRCPKCGPKKGLGRGSGVLGSAQAIAAGLQSGCWRAGRRVRRSL